MPSTTVHTFCRYCLASCGVEVTVEDNRVRKISADRLNPHSWHDFCAKGRTAAELVDHPRRIRAPMRRVGDRYVEATWDEAITDIAARINAAIEADGPDAVGAYYGNPTGFSGSNVIFMNPGSTPSAPTTATSSARSTRTRCTSSPRRCTARC
ncbi:UNVERIFIED_ORG: anaerobic selenocysteine-containing dehydrogenase [Mycolicibacterium obuense]